MHIVYFSPTGGTRKAAYIIGKEIDPQATEIDIIIEIESGLHDK